MPKPFAFKLDRVLDYRRQLKDEAVAVLAKAQAMHDAQQEIRDNLETRLKAHLRKGFKKDGTADDVWLWEQYKNGLEQDLSKVREELAKLALILQKCRQDAVERSKDCKLLDKLKETQSKRHKHEENLKEQKEFDELAALRYEGKDI